MSVTDVVNVVAGYTAEIRHQTTIARLQIKANSQLVWTPLSLGVNSTDHGPDFSSWLSTCEIIEVLGDEQSLGMKLSMPRPGPFAQIDGPVTLVRKRHIKNFEVYNNTRALEITAGTTLQCRIKPLEINLVNIAVAYSSGERLYEVYGHPVDFTYNTPIKMSDAANWGLIPSVNGSTGSARPIIKVQLHRSQLDNWIEFQTV